jgi:membrane protein YqaA with SNARE-associated domain
VAYLALAGVVFGVNLLPAFGPPTWSILVYARLRWHLEPVALVIVGAAAATTGRLILGTATRRVRGRFSPRYRENLTALEARLTRRRSGLVAFITLFVISPLPSAQLFSAAGLLELRLVPLCLAFFAGRLVTYTLYVTTAVVVETQLSSVLANVWGNPWWIALQLVLLVGLTLLPTVPWDRVGRARRSGAPR